MIKVLIIDDSALTRMILQKILDEDPQIEVVGVAADPIIASKKMDKLQPDVITLDMEMPRMDGLTFLKRLMKQRPMPVVVISGTTEKASFNAIKALELGAVEVLEKPHVADPDKLFEVKSTIRTAVKAAFETSQSSSDRDDGLYEEDVYRPSLSRTKGGMVAIGSSTGGPEVLKKILSGLDTDCTGVVIAQHMPNTFTKSFADRLHELSDIEVKLAEHGDLISQGKALIIPGDHHGRVKRKVTGELYVSLDQNEKVNMHRPSVDVLFESVAQSARSKALAVILTGMGADGAKGMVKVKHAGGMTVAQNENSCVVYGMPRKAVELGGVEKVCSISQITTIINSY